MKALLRILSVAVLLGVDSLHLHAQTLGSPNDSALLTYEGSVQISRAGVAGWVAAQTNSVLHVGDRIRTGLRSRAVVRLANRSDLRIDELTTFTVRAPSASGKTARVDVQSGTIYFFSRERPSDVEFSTPLSSGAIRGTEFNLAVAPADGRTVVTLIDGALSITNSFGALDIVSGEAATVEVGQPPKKTAVINAVNIIQWCLYYPGVIDLSELNFSSAEQQALAASLADYRAGDLLAALADYPAGRGPGPDTERIYFAQLLLAVGQADQAESQLNSMTGSSPLARALREVVAAVKRQPWARPAAPTSASGWLADSYYFQSLSKLDQARTAARQAVAKSPDFGFGWERVAELEFSFGRVPAAREALAKALRLSPRNAEAVSLMGFLYAADNKTGAARRQFDAAIALDDALGNAWLGRGLLRIHSGDAAGGRRDLQVAVTVEPQRAILRSYLGKAFANVYDDQHAQKEFAMAQSLDPNDPTVWLYRALLDERENRVNDAVRDLEKSQQLNDNRSVYRSQLLLDQDRAVRGANLANIYSDDAMPDVSMREAVRAVNSDYANYSAHLFLANSYYLLLDPNRINLRYETPYDSEYLIANLLAPVGAGTLSQQVSQQEYSKLFEHNDVGAVFDSQYLSHGDWQENGAEYGSYGNTAFAFEQGYTHTRLYRANSDLSDTSYDFQLKQQITPRDSVYAQVAFDNSSGGNLIQYYDQGSATNAPYRYADRQDPNLVAGFHHEWAPGVDTLFLAARLEDKYTVTNPLSPAYLTVKNDPGTPILLLQPFLSSEDYDSALVIYSIEAQQIWQTHQFTTIAGVRYQNGNFDTINFQQTSDLAVGGIFPSPTIADQHETADFERETLYDYEQWQPLDSLRFIAGVSYDRIKIPEIFRYVPISSDTTTGYHLSPKGGIIWTPGPDTTIRAAYSQSAGGASYDQSFQLEPSQVAGFNQAFRSLIPEAVAGANAGATFTTYGVSIEQKLPTQTYLALEGDILKSHVFREDGTYELNDTTLIAPITSQMGERLDFTEASVTFSLHQLIDRDWSFGAIYRLSSDRLVDTFTEITSAATVLGPYAFFQRQDLHGVLQTVDLTLNYQNPCGFFAQAESVWNHQDNRGYSPALPGDDFWEDNLIAGWRFFHRHLEVSAGVLNLAGADYHLAPLNLYNETPRDRTFYTQIKVQF